MQMAERKKWFVFGSVIAILPIVLWIALPNALFTKLALRLNVDDRLISVYAFMLGVVQKSRRSTF